MRFDRGAAAQEPVRMAGARPVCTGKAAVRVTPSVSTVTPAGCPPSSRCATQLVLSGCHECRSGAGASSGHSRLARASLSAARSRAMLLLKRSSAAESGACRSIRSSCQRSRGCRFRGARCLLVTLEGANCVCRSSADCEQGWSRWGDHLHGPSGRVNGRETFEFCWLPVDEPDQIDVHFGVGEGAGSAWETRWRGLAKQQSGRSGGAVSAATATAALSIETQLRLSSAYPQAARSLRSIGSGGGAKFHPLPHSWDGGIFIRGTLAGCSLR